jgi:hypothetical protein
VYRQRYHNCARTTGSRSADKFSKPSDSLCSGAMPCSPGPLKLASAKPSKKVRPHGARKSWRKQLLGSTFATPSASYAHLPWLREMQASYSWRAPDRTDVEIRMNSPAGPEEIGIL